MLEPQVLSWSKNDMQRYPEGIDIDIETFRRTNWKAVINSGERDGYHGLWQSLSAAARVAIENGETAEGKVLWLLADACSMMLNPNSPNEPFKPSFVIGNKRSALPEDFQSSEIELFSQIVEEIDDIWLQARVADILWLLYRPRNPKYALLVIDAYRSLPLDNETWIPDGKDCWERAFQLSRMLKTGAGRRIEEMEEAVILAFEITSVEDGFLALWLSDLLEQNRLGHSKRVEVANKLELIAQKNESKDIYRAREFFKGALKWFKLLEDKTKMTQVTVKVAETWVNEAEARISSDDASYLVAVKFYENAIQEYRSIPRSERGGYKVDERITELHNRLNIAGEKSLDEMSLISSTSIDLSESVENARQSVRGKTALESLKTFANLYSGARVDQIKEFSEKLIGQSPFQALISATHMSRDGRVIAKRPGIDFENPNSTQSQATTWAEMVKYFGQTLQLVVHGRIGPALEVLLQEHRWRENIFVELAANSPIVPKGRERLFGKALFAGFELDFVSALHLLVPQIEHMVRWHLKGAGVKTTTLDRDGIENENGLSTLMDIPEVAQIFSPDLTFELKALFCDPFGPNLRNELAHGLLDDEACQSAYVVYAWWLGLRLVFNTYWTSRNQRQDE